jgi:protein gp37
VADGSSIEWTDATWNPTTGCTKISPGCKHCYAERMAGRLEAMGSYNYRNGFELTLQPQMLDRPLSWRKPRRIFVNSMSDLFHDAVPDEFILKVFRVMEKAHWHQFQVLTKRATRLQRLSRLLPTPHNVWLGTSVESVKYYDRIEKLRAASAAMRFLSIEPLLGPLPDLDLRGIDWVIVGGESGPGARPLQIEWVREIRDTCRKARVPFFLQTMGRRFQKAYRAPSGWKDLGRVSG